MTVEKTDCEVLVVGAGPVGLALAIELGQRGVKCLLIEKRDSHSILPKMERCHARTMEHFRRLGIADGVRAIGYPQDAPFDAFFVSTLAEPALARMPRASINEARAQFRLKNDGSSPVEPYQIVSQYAIEPFLREVAERTPGVTVQFSCEFLGLEEKDDHVAVRIRDANGERIITALYVAGCDGASSPVREALGFKLEGNPEVRHMGMGHFRCEGLFDRIPVGKGCHYFRADDRWSFLIVQGDTRHVTLHAQVEDPNELPGLLEDFAGMPIDYEALYLGKWTMRLMLADRYASRRVFLAGDSAHLVTPIGGLGMNTGIGDALDLAWKLAATVQGWGGEGLLASYEPERRSIGRRNVDTAERAYNVQVGWRTACAEVVRSNPTEAEKKALGALWLEEHGRGSCRLSGITQGYRYLNSPIILREEDDDGADQASFEYIPTTRAGARIPHIWLSDGSALQDKAGMGYALVSCRPASQDARLLKEAFAELGAEFTYVDLSGEPNAKAVYEKDLILLRPDLHVAWRGDSLPGSARDLARHVAGWLDAATKQSAVA